MRLLVLGGTWYLGRIVVEQAVARGWTVTTFSRGLHGVDVEGAEPVRGDRTVMADIDRLATHGPWDAVVDTSGQVPAVVGGSVRRLAGRVGRYAYVSTVNVYAGWPNEPLDDHSPLRPSRPDLEADRAEQTQGLAGADAYGTYKAGCELAIHQELGGDALILRPGVLLGPYEYVGRLPWLLRRMERGGRVLAAGPAQQPIQPLDARDLAAFILDSVELGRTGAMNTTAPIGHSTYGDLLEACRAVAGPQAEVTWVDRDWLAGQEVRQWSEIPLWRTSQGAWSVRADRAHELGLVCRPLEQTVADTWAWLQAESPMPHGRQAEIGLTAQKEARLLAGWDRARAP